MSLIKLTVKFNVVGALMVKWIVDFPPIFSALSNVLNGLCRLTMQVNRPVGLVTETVLYTLKYSGEVTQSMALRNAVVLLADTLPWVRTGHVNYILHINEYTSMFDARVIALACRLTPGCNDCSGVLNPQITMMIQVVHSTRNVVFRNTAVFRWCF